MIPIVLILFCYCASRKNTSSLCQWYFVSGYGCMGVTCNDRIKVCLAEVLLTASQLGRLTKDSNSKPVSSCFLTVRETNSDPYLRRLLSSSSEASLLRQQSKSQYLQDPLKHLHFIKKAEAHTFKSDCTSTRRLTNLV